MTIYDKIFAANTLEVDGVKVKEARRLKISEINKAKIIIGDGIIIKDRYQELLPKKIGDAA